MSPRWRHDATTDTRGAEQGKAATALRVAAVLLGIVAVAAVLTTTVAVVRAGSWSGRTAAPPAATAGSAGEPGTGAPPGAASSPSAGSPGTPSIRPYPDPLGGASPSAPDGTDPGAAGGISAARSRVAAFVSALNRKDFQRANGFLCSSMAGQYSAMSLDGIVPGSLGVGGVSLSGDTGTAIVTYQETSGDGGRAVFSLVVEHQQWMVCDPQ